jgi:hypothetical protein
MLYADDTQLYISCDIKNSNTAVRNMNDDLSRLYDWCNDHGLVLNISKCKPMIIGYSRLLSSLNENEIEPIIYVLIGEGFPFQLHTVIWLFLDGF